MTIKYTNKRNSTFVITDKQAFTVLLKAKNTKKKKVGAFCKCMFKVEINSYEYVKSESKIHC